MIFFVQDDDRQIRFSPTVLQSQCFSELASDTVIHIIKHVSTSDTTLIDSVVIPTAKVGLKSATTYIRDVFFHL